MESKALEGRDDGTGTDVVATTPPGRSASRPPVACTYFGILPPRPPVSLHPLVTDDRLSVELSLYPPDVEFVTGGRGVYTQRSVAKGRTRGREGTPVARDRDTGWAGVNVNPPSTGPTRAHRDGSRSLETLVCVWTNEVPGSNPGRNLGPRLEAAIGCFFFNS